MWRLSLLILCFSRAETVFGFKCYNTDLEKLFADQILTMDNEIVDCHNLMNQTFPDFFDIRNITPQCFTTLIKGNIFTMEVKGCLLYGSCSEMEKTFKLMSIFIDTDIECNQCEGELCNSESKIGSSCAALKHLSSLFLFLLASVVLTF